MNMNNPFSYSRSTIFFAPFRSPPQQSSFANESQDLSDVTHQPPGQQERHSPQRDCLRHQHRKMAKPGNEVTDSELLLSMASRLRLVENELLLSKREIIEKVNAI